MLKERADDRRVAWGREMSAVTLPRNDASPRETFIVMASADRRGVRDIDGKATFGVCPACAALDALAARTLDAHPGVRRLIGSPGIARHRVLTASYALAVLGVEPSETYTADGLLSLLDRLSVLGAAAAWHRQFAPIWHDGVSGAPPPPSPGYTSASTSAPISAVSTAHTSQTGCRPAPSSARPAAVHGAASAP